MQPERPLRLRWDRISALGAVLVSLVLVGIIAAWSATADRTVVAPTVRPVAALATTTTTTAAPDPSGCAAGAAPGTVVRHAPAVAPKTVALTFDDGPSRFTPQVLEILRRYHVHATFFPIGGQLGERTDTVREIAAQGNMVGNHTWSHRPPAAGHGWDQAVLARELSRTDDALRAITGFPSCWFRPPEGVLAGAAPVASAHNLRLGLWSIDSEDWLIQSRTHRGDPTSMMLQVLHNAVDDGQDHPVVLLHDGGGDRSATVAALPSVIIYYQSRGYAFVRLDGRR